MSVCVGKFMGLPCTRSFHKMKCHVPKVITYSWTSLNPVANAQVCVCVFDDTYYKIITRNYISKTSLYITFQMYPSGPWLLKILMFALLVTHEIATNYISKTSLYITFQMYPLGPWPLKILMFALLVTHEIATCSWPWEKTRDNKYMLSLLLILIWKSWGCPPCGRACLSYTTTHAQTGGYLFLPGFSFMYDAIHGWMMRRMDGWMKSFTKNDHDVLYYM